MLGGKKGAFYVFLPLVIMITFLSYEYLCRTDKHLHEEFIIPTIHLPAVYQNLHAIQASSGEVESVELPESAKTLPCDDVIWCSVPMPSRSLFRFPDNDIDAVRWRKAQIQAASGDPILLRRIFPHFPNYLDFLDGDVMFRAHHMIVDHFVSQDQEFDFLAAPVNEKHEVVTDIKASNGFVPPPYYAQRMKRAPIVRPGFGKFSRDGDAHMFQGRKVGDDHYDLSKILRNWRKVKDQIATPFIMQSIFNENWGLLSGPLPNRTTNWLPWPTPRLLAELSEMLEHNRTLLFMVNQHSNFTHPKLLTLPRGLPINYENHQRELWDLMHQYSQRSAVKKHSFAFLASSNWGYRPQLKACIQRSFPTDTSNDVAGALYFNGTSRLEVHGYDKKLKGRISEHEYYDRLSRAKVSLAIGGLGYDTFRLWESLTLGTVAVIERGVGLDKTVWRLPVLLVDDFHDVTPALLRMAYVEALYRVEEFEFERLTQSFWWTFIMNVSTTRSSQTVYDKFPPEADDPSFVRPFEYFNCHQDNSCGPGTKRIPVNMC